MAVINASSNGSVSDNMLPFEKKIWDEYEVFDNRSVFIVIDPVEARGQSSLASLCNLHGRGIDMTVYNDGEKLMQALCNSCIERQLRDPKMLFIDVSRSLNEEKLRGMYAVIEQVKKGKLYDLRNRYKEWWIDSPQIWVFSDSMPNKRYLKGEKWKFFTINDTNELVVLSAGEAVDLQTTNIS